MPREFDHQRYCRENDYNKLRKPKETRSISEGPNIYKGVEPLSSSSLLRFKTRRYIEERNQLSIDRESLDKHSLLNRLSRLHDLQKDLLKQGTDADQLITTLYSFEAVDPISGNSIGLPEQRLRAFFVRVGSFDEEGLRAELKRKRAESDKSQ